MRVESTIKAISASGLTLLVVVSLLMPFETLLDFQLRREFIAQNLCENLDRGITTCRGRCYLDNKIKQEGQDSDTSTRYTKQNQRFSSVYFLIEYEITAEQKGRDEYINGTIQHHYLYRFISKVFHPPRPPYDWDHTSA